MKASADIGGAYRSIQRETGATGKELTGLKTAFDTVFKTVPASADDVATALSRITQTLDLTTKATGELATQFLNLSRMTGTDLTTNINSASEAFNAWGEAIPDTGYALDAFYTISQQTGQSVSDISSTLALAAGPAKAAGLGYQETAIMVAQLGAAGVPTKQIVSSLTAVVKDATTNNRSAAGEWQNLINKFKDPSYKATADDMKILGNNTEKFANAAKQGDLDFAPLLAKIKDSPDAINDMADKTGTLSEALTLLKNRASLALKPLGDSIFGVAKDIVKSMDPVMATVEGLGKAFDKLPEPVKKATVVLGALAASSGPVLTIGGQLGSMLGPIIMNFGALLPVLLAVGIPLVAIGAAFGVLAVGLGIAYTASATFRGVLGTLTTAFQTFGGSITKAITQLTGGDFQGALDTIRTALNQLVVDLSTIDWSSVGDKIQTEIANAFSDQSSTLNKIADQLHKMIDAVPWGQLGQELGQGLGEMFSIGMGALTGTGTPAPGMAGMQKSMISGTSVATSATNVVPSSGGVSGLEDAGTTAAGQFTSGFQKGLEEGMSNINWGAVIAALWNGLYALGPQTMGKGKTVFNITADDIGYPTAAEVGQSIKNWIGSVWDNVVLGNKAILKVVFDVPVIGPVLQAAWDFLKFIFAHFSTYTATLDLLVHAPDLGKLFEDLKAIVGRAWTAAVNITKNWPGVADVMSDLAGIPRAIVSAISKTWPGVSDVLSDLAGIPRSIVSAITKTWQGVADVVGDLGGIPRSIGIAITKTWEGVGDILGDLASIPRQIVIDVVKKILGAEGLIAGAEGMVVGMRAGGHITGGPQMALIGEAGPEAVIPQKYWGGIAPWVLNSLPRYGSGSIIGVNTGMIQPTSSRPSSQSQSTVQYNAYVTVDSENVTRKVIGAFRELEQYHQLR